MPYLVIDVDIWVSVKVVVHIVAVSVRPRDVITVRVGANSADDCCSVAHCCPRPPRLRTINDRCVCRHRTSSSAVAEGPRDRPKSVEVLSTAKDFIRSLATSE